MIDAVSPLRILIGALSTFAVMICLASFAAGIVAVGALLTGR